jgi:hypothetical protein
MIDIEVNIDEKRKNQVKSLRKCKKAYLYPLKERSSALRKR